jgi:hypothetical protein
MLSMFLQVWERGRRKNTRVLASPRLAGPGQAGLGLQAKGADARRARGWSAKIRVQLLREIGFLLQIYFLLRL